MTRWQSMGERVHAYLAARRGMGYALRIEGEELQRFARFAEQRGHCGPVTLALALAWAEATSASRLYKARRLTVVRGLAKYCVLFEPETEVPPTGMLGSAHRRLTPHIYSDDELQALLTAADQLEPAGGLRAATVHCYLGLLAATGLRVSEALQLTRADVDLVHGVVMVRQGKFHKSRLAPLHPSTLPPLIAYRTRCEQSLSSVPTTFFALDRGRPLRYGQIRYAFQCLRHQLGWDCGPGRRPRLYDLRHTFACRCLLRWYATGVDVNWALPQLSTYLGHVKVSDTYWYLTAIPELLAKAAARFENLTQPVAEGRS